jgi:hypothetical protein
MITCIDPHRDEDWYNNSDNKIRIKTENQKTIYETFKSNILDEYGDKVVHYRDRSSNVLPELKSKFDLIYVDGNHEFYHTYMDGKLSMNLLKKTNHIMFDDYSEKKNKSSKYGEVFRAVELLKQDNIITSQQVLHDKDVLILKNAP